jgi:hypothetical protein
MLGWQAAPASARPTESVYGDGAVVAFTSVVDGDDVYAAWPPVGALCDNATKVWHPNFIADGEVATLPCATLRRLVVDFRVGADHDIELAAFSRSIFPALSSVDVFASGADSILGSQVDDVISAGSVTLAHGNAGDDRISGAVEAFGDAGDDIVDLGFGTGTGAHGGTGDDVLRIDRSTWVPSGATVVTLGPDGARTRSGDAAPTTTPYDGFETVSYAAPAAPPAPFTVDASTATYAVRLVGGAHGDVLVGGPRADSLAGGAGEDTILARDGVADTVDCGAGADTVVADAVDVLSGCETVQLPPVTGPVAGPTGTAAPQTGAIRAPKVVAQGRVLKATVTSSAPAASYACRVDGGGWRPCSATPRIPTKKLRKGRHTLAVRASAGGLTDATPSTWRFVVR